MFCGDLNREEVQGRGDIYIYIYIYIYTHTYVDDSFYFVQHKLTQHFKATTFQPRQCIKKQRHHFANNGPSSQTIASSSHVWMWELDHKESWTSKNWCFWTMVLEKTLESLLESKEVKPVNPKGNQPWILIGRTDAEAETPILWPPDAKSWLIGKDPDSGKNWRHEEKGMIEDEMVGWHQQLDRHEFEQDSGVVDGQGGLVCCSPWGHKESDRVRHDWTTDQYFNNK